MSLDQIERDAIHAARMRVLVDPAASRDDRALAKSRLASPSTPRYLDGVDRLSPGELAHLDALLSKALGVIDEVPPVACPCPAPAPCSRCIGLEEDDLRDLRDVIAAERAAAKED